MNSASLCSQAGRYDNPFPIRFIAPKDCLKIQFRLLFLSYTLKSLSIIKYGDQRLVSYIYNKAFGSVRGKKFVRDCQRDSLQKKSQCR
jgi:hypothetical protein